MTIILSYFVLHEQLVAAEYGGMALILLGMLSVTYGNYIEQKRKTAAEDDERQRLLVND